MTQTIENNNSSANESGVRIGVDVGGTFTDLVIVGNDGVMHARKTLSTPDDYGRGVVDCLETALRDLRIDPGSITRLVHATTVATNTILEGKGARTALITTRGFRDVLEMRRLRIPEMYTLNYQRPEPIVPRRRRLEVRQRMGPRGEVREDLDESSVAEALEEIRAADVEALAICLLHSYANPDHERRIASAVRDTLGTDIFISCSSDILPEIREYERTSTTVINACLGPILQRYFSSLIRHLLDIGVTAPLQVMKSDGGIMSAAAAMEKPAHLVESGPAAGVIGAARVTAADGSAISLDMGGTTAKAAIVEDGEMTTTGDYEVGAGINLSSKLIMGGGHALKLPVVDLSEIGAGGGSLVTVDKGGLLHVGPESAGALPGPVAYDRGGTAPTFTDAMVVLGYLNPEYLVGGGLRLNSAAANEALREKVAGPLNRDILDVAYGIFRIATGRMVRAVKAVSTYRGRDPRDFDLFAFGGNGPVAATEIASQLNMSRILVPLNPGVFSAFGLLLSDMRNEVSQALLRRLAELDRIEVEAIYTRLEAEAKSVLKADRPVEIDRLIDLRYTEQAHELTIPYVDDLMDLARLFSDEHARTYGHEASIESVECVALRVAARIPVEGVETYDLLASLSDSGRPPCRRMAFFGSTRIETPVVTRWDVLQEPRMGPLIIEEYDSTCVVPPGWSARVDNRGNIELLKDRSDNEVEY